MTSYGASDFQANACVELINHWWHVLGMFVPSLFTGNLIKHFGVLPVMAAAVLGGRVAVALSGVAFAQFLSALVQLGVGWKFLFIGGTTLPAEAYRPIERA
jgi:hypothetical protein